MDGKQVTTTIRKLKSYGSNPIIAIRTYALVGGREEFMSAGCSHYISKPFIQESVSNLKEEILKRITSEYNILTEDKGLKFNFFTNV